MKKKHLKITTLLALLVMLLAILTALLPGLFTRYDPLEIDPAHRLEGISTAHICGTDEYGRDIWSRIVYGTRNSMEVGFGAALLAMLAGVPLGLLAGWYGGILDSVVMRIMDAFQSFPAVLLAILFISLFEPSALTLILTIALVSFPYFARIVRSNVLYVKEAEYVEASRAFGARSGYLLFRAILPNCVSAIIIQFSLLTATAILLEAGLSFLGLGIAPPAPAWGSMLSYARAYIDSSTCYMVAPTLAIFLLVLSVNILGDALRDVFDPKNRNR